MAESSGQPLRTPELLSDRSCHFGSCCILVRGLGKGQAEAEVGQPGLRLKANRALQVAKRCVQIAVSPVEHASEKVGVGRAWVERDLSRELLNCRLHLLTRHRLAALLGHESDAVLGLSSPWRRWRRVHRP